VNVLVLEHQVPIWWSDQDLSVLQALALVGRAGGERAGARQNVREHAGAVGRDVKDYADSRW
jgi:hypothetical protein